MQTQGSGAGAGEGWGWSQGELEACGDRMELGVCVSGRARARGGWMWVSAPSAGPPGTGRIGSDFVWHLPAF